MTFVDVQTMTRTGDKVRFWDYDIYSPAEQLNKSMKSHSEVSCSTRTETYLTLIAYKKVGTVVSESGSGAKKDIAPDTFGETELKFVCADVAMRAKLGTRLNLPPDDLVEKLRTSARNEQTPPQ